MTAVVGVVGKGRVYMAADSAGTCGYSIQGRKDSKIFFKSPSYIIGFAGSFRVGQVLRHRFQPDPPPESDSALDAFMCTEFIDGMRASLRVSGCVSVENEVESIPSTVMVGVGDHLFVIDNDFQVGEVFEGYAAIGSGSDVALGSLYSTARRAARPRLLLALEAAAQYNAAVRPPFLFAH